jgi:hypothetical protein
MVTRSYSSMNMTTTLLYRRSAFLAFVFLFLQTTVSMSPVCHLGLNVFAKIQCTEASSQELLSPVTVRESP